MKANAFSMTMLFDFYGELLTEKQRQYFDLYSEQDLSLAEIAECEGVTRQAVHDVLSRTEAILLNFEEKIGCVAKAAERRKSLDDIRAAAEQVRALPGGADAAEAILSACDAIKE